MSALNPQQRAFVVAYCTTANCNATEAARQAGYSDPGTGSIRVRGHQVLHHPKVLEAIREFTLASIRADAPVLVDALKKVAGSVQHKDQVKAIGMLLNRGGLPEITEKNINVNVTITKEEKIAEIRLMAEEMGLDPEKLLGNITDAEFEEVDPDEDKVW